ncbi:MAG TPA: DEAD/DEAH box helicase [Verrucomicrobiae bacterium]
MTLAQELASDIQPFLESVPPETKRRGREYFDSGRVTNLDCIQPNRRYTAIVEGGEFYAVDLRFLKFGWSGNCSCPMGVDCKHVVAALLALREAAKMEPGTQARPGKGPARKSREVLQPAATELYNRAVNQLGRKLRRDEATYIRRVQAHYGTARMQGVTEYMLHEIAGPTFLYRPVNSWQKLELWPETPRNDYIFWLFIARELRRRELPTPEFLEGITDLSLIEDTIKNWARQKEITYWRKWFQNFDGDVKDVDAPVLELRCVVHAEGARLQWRMNSSAPFADLKQGQAKKLGEQFNEGKLTIAPESLSIWTATYKPWHYESWWAFDYDDVNARRGLGRLLRLELASDRIVAADGQPIARAAEPLRLELRPPLEREGDYELKLATPDGLPAPPVLCVLEGRPTLYLTERCIFEGPPADALGKDTKKGIPASALETTDGLRFLQAARVPLPEHLRERIHNIPVQVTITCQLQEVFKGSESEDLVMRVSAHATEMSAETYTPDGWRVFDSAYNKRPKNETGTDDLVIYDRTAQRRVPNLLAPLGLKWNYNGEWRLRLNKKTPGMFAEWLATVPPEIELILDKQLASLRNQPVAGKVALDVSEAGIDWFDLKIVLNVSDTTLTQEELKLLLNARGGYVRLGKKGWHRLQFDLTPEEDGQLARLGLNPRDFTAEPQRLHALQLADNAAKKFLAPERFEKIQRRASELKTRVTPPLPASIRAEMRPYQTDGFHFLAYLTSNRFGGVLADDMGLGKTLQTLAWLAWLRETGSPAGNAPSLVVCPKSVVDNWRAEAERFYPELRVRLWSGESNSGFSESRNSADLIVINYSQLRSLWPPIANWPWLAVVLDEAQYIKNPDSQTAQVARSLIAEHRLALTGTPIENRLLDLWSIFGFAMPGVLGNRAHFLRRFDAKDDPLARQRLAARVRPFLLRRTKSQVAKDLPDRVEEDLLCEMEGEQKTLYRAEMKRAQQIILGLKSSQELNKERFNILTSLLRLRQICCHPALIDNTLRDAASSKLGALEDVIEPLMEEGHKVLVFSQFVTMLHILREKMEERNWPYFYLAGDTENRGELVREFQAAKGGAVFLISLKAGGFGLNLTAASYVVLFDPWWNPAVENQAIDRTHRIGQTSKVMAYRLLMRDSIEQKIRALQKQKGALAEDVLGEERFAQSLTLDDLRFLFAE